MTYEETTPEMPSGAAWYALFLFTSGHHVVAGPPFLAGLHFLFAMPYFPHEDPSFSAVNVSTFHHRCFLASLAWPSGQGLQRSFWMACPSNRRPLEMMLS